MNKRKGFKQRVLSQPDLYTSLESRNRITGNSNSNNRYTVKEESEDQINS